MENGFFIQETGDGLRVEFESVTDFKAIRQLEFTSRLLYGLAPDSNNIWQIARRSDFFIVGFPPTLEWHSPRLKSLIAKPTSDKVSMDELKEQLEEAIVGICAKNTGEDDARYSFAISNGNDTWLYNFHNRARTVCALAVLFDLETHPRKDLEIWINPDLTDKIPPGNTPDLGKAPEQYYGDPSKTADVLRNEGWSREAQKPCMLVVAKQVNGQSQQHYQITQREQPLENQVMRSVISNRWRASLFESQDFVCQICLGSFADSTYELSPDHRIPVIFQADALDDSNYLEKLMTLCRFCNQSKREFAKRVSYDYDWQSSPWAFPERFRTQIIVQQVQAISASTGESVESVLSDVRKSLQLPTNNLLDC